MANKPAETNGPTEKVKWRKEGIAPEQMRKLYYVLAILVPILAGINEWHKYNRRADMMKIIETFGGEKDPLSENYLCFNIRKRIERTIPKNRRGEKPIKVEICGTTVEAIPYCAEKMQSAMAKAQKEGICSDILRSGATNEEQMQIWVDSLDEPLDEAIAKILKGELPKQKYIAAIPCGSFHEGYCAIDDNNWKKTGKYFRKEGFPGGTEFWGLVQGIFGDSGHFSRGEFRMKGLHKVIESKIRKWRSKKRGKKGKK